MINSNLKRFYYFVLNYIKISDLYIDNNIMKDKQIKIIRNPFR